MNELRAEDILSEYELDPDLESEPPQRPRIIPELLLSRDGSEGFLIVGGKSRSFVRGAHATHLLPRLWPLLDGTRMVEDLAGELKVSTVAVSRVLALLHRAGLLEDRELGVASSASVDTRCLLGRWVSAYGKYPDRGSALLALSECKVGIFATPSQYQLLADELRAVGVGTIIDLSKPTSVALTHALVLSSNAPLSEQWQCNADKLSRARTLFGSTKGESFAIGPFRLPDASACLGCCKAASDDALPAGEFDPFSTAAIGNALIGLLAGIHGSAPFDRIELSLCEQGQWSRELRAVPRTPGCAECGLGAHESLLARPAAQLAWAFVSGTAYMPGEMLTVRAHEGHYAGRLQSVYERPDQPAARCSLELPRVLRGIGTTSSWRCPDRSAGLLGRLSYCLQLAFGFEHGEGLEPHKIAPSGGGLRSPEAYVITRGQSELPDGIYRYQADLHALIRVRDALDDIATLESALGGELADHGVVIVGTTRVERLRPKYRSRSQKIGFLDCGVALTYLLEAASTVSWEAELYEGFHRGLLLRLLDIPSLSVAAEPGFVLSLQECPVPLESHPNLFSTPGGMARLSTQRMPMLSGEFTGWRGQGQATSTPESFTGMLLARRSRRMFSEAPVSLRVSEQLLRATESRNRLMDKLSGRRLPVRCVLVTHASHDDPSSRGLYALNELNLLELLRGGLDKTHVRSCYNQKTIGSAPVVLIAEFSFPEALEACGPAGVIKCLVRASALLAHAYILASSLGLIGSFSGGLLEADFRRTFARDGYSQCPLFTLALGHPPSAPA